MLLFSAPDNESVGEAVKGLPRGGGLDLANITCFPAAWSVTATASERSRGC